MKMIDAPRKILLSKLSHISLKVRQAAMFKDLFDFGKKRTLKESVGFFIFHSGLVLGAMFVLDLLGIA